MAWVILIIAGLFESGWAIGLKYTEGFSRLWPSVYFRPIAQPISNSPAMIRITQAMTEAP